MTYVTLKDYLSANNKKMAELGLELFCRDYGCYLTACEAYELYDFQVLGMVQPDYILPAAEQESESSWFVQIDLCNDSYKYQLIKVGTKYDSYIASWKGHNDYRNIVPWKDCGEVHNSETHKHLSSQLKQFFIESFTAFMKQYFGLKK